MPPFDPFSDPHLKRGSELSSTPTHVFKCSKAPLPVETRRRWHVDGLRALALDPKVREFRAYGGNDRPPEDVETCVTVMMDEGRVVVGFARERSTDHGFLLGALPFVTLTRSDVEVEPRFTTVREIWSAARTPIDPADRIRVMRALREKPDGIAIGELEAVAQYPAIDPIHVVLALVVEGELVIDIDAKLTDATIVRRVSVTGVKAGWDKELSPICKTGMPAMHTAERLSGAPLRTRKTKAADRRQMALLLPIKGGQNADEAGVRFGGDSMTSEESDVDVEGSERCVESSGNARRSAK